MKTGTWAYMGSVSDTGSDHKNQDRYWFWTSVDINKNGFQAGETVPMIVSTADGKFYISNSQTTTRTSNGMTCRADDHRDCFSGLEVKNNK